MTDFFALRKRKAEIEEEYFRTLQTANDHFDLETEAAIVIQSAHRSCRVRHRWHKIQNAAKLVQRVARGMLGRARYDAFLLRRANMCNLAYFNHCATTIQKAFRGFWSCNYTHCMQTRKEYLKNVGSIATRTSAYLSKYGNQQKEVHEKSEEQKRKDQFNELAKDLHHLCSTQTIPGVYNPPYSEAVPTAFNVPIEQHLRLQSSAVIPKSLRRPDLNRSVPSNFRPVDPLECGLTKQTETVSILPNKRKPLLTRTANIGRGSRVQGPFRSVEEIEVSNAKAYDQYRSVQSNSKYTAIEEDYKLQSRLSKLVRVSPEDFHSRKPTEDKMGPTVQGESRYMGRPVEFRSDYTELPKIKGKPPYFTAFPRDKDLADYDDKKFRTGLDRV